MAEYAIGALSQIPPGEGRTFDLGGLRVAVFHTRSGQVFATQALCPHKSGPLADGLTDEVSVVCPLHDRMFNFRTGAGLGNDCRVATYSVRVDTEGMTVLLSDTQTAMEITN